MKRRNLVNFNLKTLCTGKQLELEIKSTRGWTDFQFITPTTDKGVFVTIVLEITQFQSFKNISHTAVAILFVWFRVMAIVPDSRCQIWSETVAYVF